jgi:hypothetical protein
MVKTTGPSPSLVIKETDKVSGQQGTQILGKNSLPQLRLAIFESDTLLSDALVLYQHELATPQIDEFDSEKWNNPGLTFYTKDTLGNKYSIQAIPDFGLNQTIFLGIEKLEAKSYQMKFNKVSFEAKGWYLLDQFTKEQINIELKANYAFKVTTDSLSFHVNRFVLFNGQLKTGFSENEADLLFSISPQPCSSHIQLGMNIPILGLVKFEVLSALGQVIKCGQLNTNQTLAIDELPQGLYYLKLSVGEKNHLKKFIKL